MTKISLPWKQSVMIKYLLYTNTGASDMALNCVYSMIKSGIEKNDILLYTIDTDTENKFKDHNINVTKLDASESIGESNLFADSKYQDWNTKGFHRVVHYKIKSIIDALSTGDDIFYLDTDNVVFKDPREFVESVDSDIVIQDDSDIHGRWKSLCTGVVFIKSNEKTKLFYEKCLDLHMKNIELDKSTGDQAAFNQVLVEKHRHGLSDLIVSVFPHEIFPNGQIYFESSVDKENMYLFHNNHISGLEAKVERFKDNGYWYVDCDNFYNVLSGKICGQTQITP